MTSSAQYKVTALTPFGVLVEGLEPARADAATSQAMARLLAQHQVVVVRGHTPPDDDQIARLFAGMGVLSSETPETQGHFEALAKSAPSLLENGATRVGARFNLATNSGDPDDKSLGRGSGASELNWHNDQAQLARLKIVGCLEAVEFEPGAGNTLFCNMYTALDLLPADLRRELESLTAVHDLTIFRGPDAGGPSTERPVIVPHPVTGRRCLYVSPSFTSRVVGLSAEKGAALLKRLFAHAYSEGLIYEHQWRAGDLVAWDNVGVQHMRPPLDPAKRRVLRAIQGVSEASETMAHVG